MSLIAVAAVLSLGFAGEAWAYHISVSAQAECTSEGVLIINYVSSVDPMYGVENNQIDILFNSNKVASGAYLAPTYSFSGSAPVPDGSGPGDVVSVTARVIANWSDGWIPGASASVSVTLPSDLCGVQVGLGRFTGGGHQVRVGEARVTRGLTIHCDLLLSNNLEVNWGGNQFHMTEHLETVACTDDPLIIQAPPVAPLDTLIGVGTGRYNGTGGFTIEFTLIDAGEPGGSDMAAIKIYQTATPANVVLNIPLQLLSGGNLQAHYDQPHK
jgi:hypothetical protein